VSDYVDENIMDRLDTPRGQELLSIIDPYEYRDRLDQRCEAFWSRKKLGFSKMP